MAPRADGPRRVHVPSARTAATDLESPLTTGAPEPLGLGLESGKRRTGDRHGPDRYQGRPPKSRPIRRARVPTLGSTASVTPVDTAHARAREGRGRRCRLMVLAHPHRAAQRPRALLEPSMAKLFASDDAVSVTQEGQPPARRLGLRGGVPDLALRRRAGAVDLRGRETDPRLEGRGARIPGGGGATLTPAGAVRGRVGAGVRIGC